MESLDAKDMWMLGSGHREEYVFKRSTRSIVTLRLYNHVAL